MKSIKPQLFFRPETGCEDRMGSTYGPFEFVQLTYGELRIGPNGDPVMFFADGMWLFVPSNSQQITFKPRKKDIKQEWSDIVIWAK